MRSLIFAIIILLASCNETEYKSETLIDNQTQHKINIKLFYNARFVNKGSTPMVVTIAPITRQSIHTVGAWRGEVGMRYVDELVLMVDSLSVTFDDLYKTIHYGQFFGQSSNYVLPTNPRSLFNSESYYYNIFTQKSKITVYEYTYTFTEQDYLDAKK